MPNKAPRSADFADLSISALARHARGWILDCEARQLAKRTLEARRDLVAKLTWFLQDQEAEVCGAMELRAFLAYVGNGHEDPRGRWGHPQNTRPVRPRTVHTYHLNLTTLFSWLVEEGAIEVSPMARIKPPVHRSDQVQPFKAAQVSALIRAARQSPFAIRDLTIVLMLLDTAMRASELCALTRADVDMENRQVRVLGKGNKHRILPFGRRTTKALWNYLQQEAPADGEGEDDTERHVFVGARGRHAGEPLTRSGVLQIITRLGQSAGIEAVRCSPHTFRHTFAIEFLRNGGNQFTLQQLLGHTDLDMTSRYVAIAQADMQNQHRKFSPVDKMK